MIGAIRRLDILAHPFVTIQCFGWRVFFRALTASGDQTFLSLLVQAGTFEPPQVTIPELVDRCIQLELRTQRVYQWLAGRFLGYQSVSAFFDTLAHQEATHAELLELCREAARRTVWKEELFAPWRDAVPRLERRLADVEASLDSLESVSDALKLVLQVECSEINQVFQSVVGASGGGFIRNVRAFQSATAEHLAYLSHEIAKLEPGLADQCREFPVSRVSAGATDSFHGRKPPR